MSLPLFVLEPMCAERKMCRECRGEDSRFRQGWAGRYRMPASWPSCPYGLPFGYEGAPKPIEPHLLGIIVDMPESEEAKELTKRLYQRADKLRPICQGCEEYIEITEDGLLVHCKKGYSCGCGQETATQARGFVHLGTGFCKLNKWGGVA